MKSEIIWRAGAPTEYGIYLILCLNNKGVSTIHLDVWFDDSKCWQSKWHDMIAWCKLTDIKFKG